MALRTVGVRLQADVAGYMANVRAAGRATRDFKGDLDRAARAGKLDAVADSAGKVGLAMTAGFGLAVGAVARFDKEMSSVSAATHASTSDMEALRQAAIRAGKDTSFSATEAAQGIEELAKAGVSTAAILGGGLDGALDLAAAGQLDVANAAEIAASAMTQFKLDGSQVPHVADLLAAGAGKAQGSVEDLGMALKQGGLVASQMGMSVEDTTGTLAAFASAGLMGSDAGTSLKTALLMLSNPSKESAALMKQLGINAYDASGNFVGIVNLSGQLREKLGGLTQEQRNAALATIFGSDAIRSASVLYEQGAQGIQGWIDKTDDAGFAAETARKKTDNLSGDVERLTGSLEALAIESGTGASSGLRTLVQGADNLVASVSNIPAPVQNAGVIIAGVGGAALLAAAGAAKLRARTSEALEQLANTGPMGQRAARGLERTQRAATKLGIALAAIQVASAVMGESVNVQTDALAKGMEKFADSGKLGGEAARVFGGDMGKLDTALHDLGKSGAWMDITRGIGDTIEGFTGMGNVMDDSLQHSRERLEGLDSALAEMVRSGNAKGAAEVFDEIAERAKKQGVSVDELKKILPGYAAAVEVAGDKTGTAADKVAGLGGQADDAADKVEDLKRAFDDLFGKTIDLDRATIEYRRGLKEMNDELTHGKRTLDTHTKAGQDNADAVLDQIEKIKNLRQARIDNNMTVDEANGKYKDELASLKKTLKQMGYNETEIDALVGKYETIPDQVNTEVYVKTKTGEQQLEGFMKKVRRADGTTITIHTRLTRDGEYIPGSGTQVRRWGGVTEYAAMGKLRDAQIASPVGGARYGWAEQATGGELFAPKYGDLNRTRALVGYAVENWWGGWQNFAPPQPVPVPVDSGGSSPEVRVFIGDRELTDIVRVEVSEHSRGLKRRATAGPRR